MRSEPEASGHVGRTSQALQCYLLTQKNKKINSSGSRLPRAHSSRDGVCGRAGFGAAAPFQSRWRNVTEPTGVPELCATAGVRLSVCEISFPSESDRDGGWGRRTSGRGPRFRAPGGIPGSAPPCPRAGYACIKRGVFAGATQFAALGTSSRPDSCFPPLLQISRHRKHRGQKWLPTTWTPPGRREGSTPTATTATARRRPARRRRPRIRGGGGQGQRRRRPAQATGPPPSASARRPPTPGPSSAASTAPTPRATAMAREAALLRLLHRPRATRRRGTRPRRPRPPAPSRPSDATQASASRIKNAQQRRRKGRSYTCHKKGSLFIAPSMYCRLENSCFLSLLPPVFCWDLL